MLNQSSLRSFRFGILSFMVVVLLLGQSVAACVGNSNVQIQCENGYETRLFLNNVDELSRFKIPEECETTLQTIQNFDSVLSSIVARVAETQWVNVSIFVGSGIAMPDYTLGECYLIETKIVGDVAIQYEHARPYCVGQTDFCYTDWSVSYVRKTLAQVYAGNIGDLGIIAVLAIVGGGFGVRVGQSDYQLERFFTRKLAYKLLGLLGVYSLVILAAYFNSWISIFEIGFLAPIMLLKFLVLPRLFQPTSFGLFCLMTVGYMFMLVFVVMQIRFSVD